MRMDKTKKTQYADVASWELSDSMWDRIAALLPNPKSRFRDRGRQRRNIDGRPVVKPRKLMSGILNGKCEV